LLAIPFWIILMAFAFVGLLTIKLSPALKILLLGVSTSILLSGLVPAIQYIYTHAKDPSSIQPFEQQHVAVARFLKAIVAGRTPASVPRLEHDEFNRVQGIPDPPYETLICASEANAGLHLFLHDYDNEKILSFCGGHPMSAMTGQEIWSDNKKAIANYVPNGKDLKLIWETGDAGTERIIRMFQSLRDLVTEDSLSFSFGGRGRTFYVLNIPYKNIREFQERVRALPDSLP